MTVSATVNSETEPAANAPSQVVRRIVAWMGQMVLAACGVSYLAGSLARFHWSFDLFSHFTLQLLLVTALLVALFSALRQWKACGLAGLLLLALVWRYVPAAGTTAPVASTNSPAFRVLLANILVHSNSFDQLASFIQAEAPDVIVLQELSSSGLKRLEADLEPFPHQRIALRDDAFGIGVFSRTPLLDVEVQQWSAELPSLTCRLLCGSSEVQLIATHPLPPVRRHHSQLRNEQLRRVREEAARHDGPVLVVGDLNCTPWSPHFRDLLTLGELRDTRSWSNHATWPASYPWAARIPIDHVLVSRHWTVQHRHEGPRYQSDHLPVSVWLTLSKENSEPE